MKDNNRILSNDESNLMSINELPKNNDQFLLNIIHDLRSYLNVITSAAQFMEHNTYKGDNNLKYIEIIKRNSFKMLKLINNLIDSNKIKNNYYKLNKKNSSYARKYYKLCREVCFREKYKTCFWYKWRGMHYGNRSRSNR